MNEQALIDAMESIRRPGAPLAEIHEWAFDETNKLLYGFDKNGRPVIALNKEQFEALDKAAVTKQREKDLTT